MVLNHVFAMEANHEICQVILLHLSNQFKVLATRSINQLYVTFLASVLIWCETEMLPVHQKLRFIDTVSILNFQIHFELDLLFNVEIVKAVGLIRLYCHGIRMIVIGQIRDIVVSAIIIHQLRLIQHGVVDYFEGSDHQSAWQIVFYY